MKQEEWENDVARDSDCADEGLKRKWSYADYLDKVEEELQAGRFASQSK